MTSETQDDYKVHDKILTINFSQKQKSVNDIIILQPK